MVLDIYGASDVGCVRELNEDSFCIYGFEQNQTPGFCVLSDGMGGHNAGEVASQRAVQFVAEELMEAMNAPEEAQSPPKLVFQRPSAVTEERNRDLKNASSDMPSI